MRYVIVLLILLLITASGAVEANSFRISFDYGNCDHDGCKAVSCHPKPNNALTKKLVMVEKRLPRRYCTVLFDRYGRKVRQCYLYHRAIGSSPQAFYRQHRDNYGRSLGYCRRGF
jgi:hypothetical protein